MRADLHPLRFSSTLYDLMCGATPRTVHPPAAVTASPSPRNE